jgi:methionyl-tRNA formyltransferase
MKDLRVIFMGTPDFSVPILASLIVNTNVILVVTKIDQKVGRNQKLSFSPVKKLALENNIPLFQPEKIKTDYQIILDLNPDIIITCAYGQIIPKEVLNCPKYGCINVHASLLPKYRGGAPIHHAIINGESKTGITIMYMNEGMDTGDIIAKEELPILETDNVGTLFDKLSLLGESLLIKTLPSIITGSCKKEKQDDSLATYAPTLKRADELLSFSYNTKEVFDKVRGLNPWPLAYIILNGEETKILECEKSYEEFNKKPGEITRILKDKLGIKTLDGEILITKIKPYGKKEMLVKDYLNGLKDKEKIEVGN